MEEIEEMENNATPVNSRKAVSYPSASAETPDVFSTHQPSTSYHRSRPQLSSLDSLLDSTESTQSHSGEFVYFLEGSLSNIMRNQACTSGFCKTTKL